ncbi:hypothetical protein [Aquifex aeolicus]|uniref:Uncharacterized protein n=1 Tax=Aquifex aeolicus (strain VF5) TaxID=224324 RepID=O67897_AQUAE|nr:hypothetical protein [Aquifex aeolicus]AAC07860.1 putative protein [Aquifex aeolicus VF5]
MKVFLYDTNLILASRVRSLLSSQGFEISDKEEACAGVVNLESPKGLEVVKELKEKGKKVVGYCGHKNVPLIQKAKELGVDEVIPNSQVVTSLGEILKKLCS